MIKSNLMSDMNVTSQNITASQLHNLISTPVELASGQGAGTVVVPFSIYMKLNFGTTPYSNLTSNLSLLLNNTVIFPSEPLPSTFLGSSQNAWVYYLFASSDMSGITSSASENQPVFLKNIGLLNLLLGDGTVDVDLYWSTYNL